MSTVWSSAFQEPRFLICVAALAVVVLVGCSRTETTTEQIPFKKTERNDAAMWKGEGMKVVTAGEPGTKEVVWRVRGSGANASREKVTERITKAPTDQVTAVGSRSEATGKEWRYNMAGVDYTLVITGVTRNRAFGGDTLEITTEVTNNKTDDVLQPDECVHLWLKNSDSGELRRWGHAKGASGMTVSDNISGGGSATIVYDFALRPGSALQADVTSVDDFAMSLDDGRGGPMQSGADLNEYWIGPIEYNGAASRLADQ